MGVPAGRRGGGGGGFQGAEGARVALYRGEREEAVKGQGMRSGGERKYEFVNN